MRHILIISLGPIQDFIAAARRCRDLWFGSWLLSESSKAVARGVAQAIDRDNLVFPSPMSDLREASPTSVANKIVAVIPGDKQPKAVAEAARAALDEQLRKFRSRVFAKIAKAEGAYPRGTMLNRTMMEEQLDDLIEFLWVAAPIENNDYSTARENAESLLAQRKRTMLWGKVPWEAEYGLPKSSLDGQRESVLNESKFPVRRPNEELDPQFVAHLRKTFRMKPNERLCGVGLLKRLGQRPGDDDAHQFLSTPHLATGPLLQRIDREPENVRSAWEAYEKALRNLGADLEETAAKKHNVLGHYDGMLLMETRLEEWFDHFDKEARKEKVKCAREALDKFFKETKLPAPLPYFAVLLADGDNMGKAIADHDTEQKHRDLSKQLDEFARGAKKIVETANHGELIYSGGDDVLAFVPLNNVIECAAELAKDFAAKLARFAHKGGKAPTLSVGIAICHFIEPMSRALELARKAEKRAKEKRDSLAVIVDKRSGPPVEVFGEWNTGIAEQLLELTSLHRHDAVPDGVAHELLELEPLRVGVDDEKTEETLGKLIQKETERILNRKRAASGKDAVDRAVIRELLKTPRQLAERLFVSGLIAKAKDIAGDDKRPLPKSSDDEHPEAT